MFEKNKTKIKLTNNGNLLFWQSTNFFIKVGLWLGLFYNLNLLRKRNSLQIKLFIRNKESEIGCIIVQHLIKQHFSIKKGSWKE